MKNRCISPLSLHHPEKAHQPQACTSWRNRTWTKLLKRSTSYFKLTIKLSQVAVRQHFHDKSSSKKIEMKLSETRPPPEDTIDGIYYFLLFIGSQALMNDCHPTKDSCCSQYFKSALRNGSSDHHGQDAGYYSCEMDVHSLSWIWI